MSELFRIDDLHAKPAEADTKILRGLSLTVNTGEVHAIMGPNGSGKSTLLKILARVLPPTKGRVIVRGNVSPMIELGAGFHPEMTGRENVYLNGAILGMTKKEITRKFDEIVDFSGVERYIDTPVKRYSSGMYVRLAFAVAEFLEPEILVVDEVLAVGDAEFQKKAIGKMQDISKGQGRTVLFVSHNIDSIKALSKHILLLDKGTLSMDDTATTVLSYYLSNSNKINPFYQCQLDSSSNIQFEAMWVENEHQLYILQMARIHIVQRCKCTALQRQCQGPGIARGRCAGRQPAAPASPCAP